MAEQNRTKADPEQYRGDMGSFTTKNIAEALVRIDPLALVVITVDPDGTIHVTSTGNMDAEGAFELLRLAWTRMTEWMITETGETLAESMRKNSH